MYLNEESADAETDSDSQSKASHASQTIALIHCAPIPHILTTEGTPLHLLLWVKQPKWYFAEEFPIEELL